VGGSLPPISVQRVGGSLPPISVQRVGGSLPPISVQRVGGSLPPISVQRVGGSGTITCMGLISVLGIEAGFFTIDAHVFFIRTYI
jgi:hypothetical protein